MSVAEIAAGALLALGGFFFVAGSVGILRFPDTPSRLHALTKADNAGLGLLALAAMLHFGSWIIAAKIALVWLFALLASGAASQLLARTVLDDASVPPAEPGPTPDRAAK